MKFLSDIEVEEGLKDGNGGLGSSGQVLSSTGSLTSWIDASGTIGGSIADNEIAVGASTANTIEGNSYFSYVPLTLDGSVASARLKVRGRLEMSDDLISGTANLYVGFGAGGTSSQGSNTGVGLGALTDQVSGVSGQGSKNCALGLSALYNLTLGAANIGIGYQSLFGLIGTGQNDNTAVGTNAAMYYSTGTDQLTQSSQGVYIGSDTRASANNISNEIAIGYGAVGGGSNTITLGNSSVDLLRIPGLGSTDGHVLTYSDTDGGIVLAAGGGGGGGTIGGATVATQIAFGAASSTTDITSSVEATFAESAGKTLLQVGSPSGKAQTLININQTNDNFSRARLELSKNNTTRGFLGIENDSTDVTLHSDVNLVLDSDGDDVIITTQTASNVGIGNTSPTEKLDVTGRIKASKGVQVGNETSTTAIAGLVGTFRYRTYSDASFDYSAIDVCMQDGASDYNWVNVVTNRW
jgi:hypothetical protein